MMYPVSSVNSSSSKTNNNSSSNSNKGQNASSGSISAKLKVEDSTALPRLELEEETALSPANAAATSLRRTNSSGIKSPKSPAYMNFPSPQSTPGNSNTRRIFRNSRNMSALEIDVFGSANQDNSIDLNNFGRSLFRVRVRALVICICLMIALVMIFDVSTMDTIQLGSNTKDKVKYVDFVDINKDAPNLIPDAIKTEPQPLPTPSPTTKPTIPETVTAEVLPAQITSSEALLAAASWWSDSNSVNNNNNATNTKAERIRPPPPISKNASQSFAERWCDLSNNNVEWFPTSKKSWQLRAPYVIFPGAKFSGVTGLVEMLSQNHAQILKPNNYDVKFFFESNFNRYVSPQLEQTKVYAARERMYASQHYPVSALQANNNTISFDATHGYLFYSTLLPRRILCIMPWVKLVIVLRNPTDRIYEHYLSAKRKGLKLTFEAWVDKDMRNLANAGVLEKLSNDTSISSKQLQGSVTTPIPWQPRQQLSQFSGSKEEDEAWYDYQSRSLEGAVGRSIYEIQLRQWFQALRAAGRNPSSTVLILQAESLQNNPLLHYKRVVKFLNLSTNGANNIKLPTRPFIVTDTTGLSAETRRRLDSFFRPYNEQLQRLLKSYNVHTIDN